MLDSKKVTESKKRVEQALERGELAKEKSGRFVSFFQENSQRSFEAAQLLYNVSTQEEMKKSVGFPVFNGFLWVINASYYSMFYMARALLEKSGVKIKTDYSVHLLTFDSLVTYFYATGKIEKQMLEEFHEANVEVEDALGREKARALMEDYLSEREKRSRFTYEMGEIALQNKAKTSLDRAKSFNEALRKMLES